VVVKFSREILPRAAVLAGMFYLAWNVYFLGNGKLPPSILYHLTGVPAPTPGGVRAGVALLDLRILDSLRMNPFLVPFIVLLLLASVQIVRSAYTSGRWAMSPLLTKVWLVTLAIGWIYQVAFFAPELGIS
jgi:hypothetical protein